MNKHQLLQEFDKDLSKKLILAILEGGAHTEEEITKELNTIRKVFREAFKEIEEAQIKKFKELTKDLTKYDTDFTCPCGQEHRVSFLIKKPRVMKGKITEVKIT